MTAQAKSKEFDRVVRTVCSPNCLGTCGVNAFVKDDRIVKLEPASFPDPGYERICMRGIAMATQRLHHPDRLTHPLVRVGARGGGQWKKVSWDEAYDRIAGKLTDVAARHGWRANSWIKGSGNYGFRASMSVARTVNLLGGTQFSYGPMSGDVAAMIAHKSTLGDFGRSNDISEVAGARYLLCAGKNIADTAHSDMHFVFDAMENGCKFVMIDSRFSRSAAKADEWAAPRPGTDAALALGMVHTVITENLFKEDYLLAHTNMPLLVRRDTRALLRERDVVPGGGESFLVWDDATGAPARPEAAKRPALSSERSVLDAAGMEIGVRTAFDTCWEVWRKYTPEYAAKICEVPAGQIRHIAREYATTEPAWIWMGLGPQRYHHGDLVVRAWMALATLCGNIGKPYAGVSIYEGANLTLGQNHTPSYVSPDGKKGHALLGTQLVDVIAKGEPYPVKTLWMAAYGFGTQSPFLRRFIQEALPNLDLFIISEQLMTSAAEYADIVLPCVSYYEDDWDVVGGGENWFLQIRRQAVTPVGDSRSDHDICKGLCEKLGLGHHWQEEPEEICRKILADHPDPRIRAVDWETLRRDGVARVPIQRPHTPFRDMKFNTPSGRIEIYHEQSVDMGEEVVLHKEQLESRLNVKAHDFPLNLISYKHTHSTQGQHMMLPYVREMMPEPRIEISPQDAADRELVDGELVRVFNDRGGFKVKVMITPGLKPGTVAIAQGWWPRDFVEGHPSFLGHVPRNTVQERVWETNYPIWDILCNVVKAEASQ